jgi:DNA-binding GntR family transcriptional regulator
VGTLPLTVPRERTLARRVYVVYVGYVTFDTSPSGAGLTNAEAAYRRLRQAMSTGEYSAGNRLEETTVAAQLGMSRTPVREALQRLRSDGLVVDSGRGGAVVATLSTDEMRQLYEMRATLEALAAGLAAQRQRDGFLSPSDINRLAQLAEAFEQVAPTGDVRATVRANAELHRAIALLAGNHFVTEALDRVWDRIAIASFHNLLDGEWARTVMSQHRRIVEAIEAGSADMASALIREHVLTASGVYAARASAEE